MDCEVSIGAMLPVYRGDSGETRGQGPGARGQLELGAKERK